MYTSLSEVQIENEEIITKNPISKGEKSIEQTPAEVLYVVSITHSKPPRQTSKNLIH